MTVKELIAELEKFDDDMGVLIDEQGLDEDIACDIQGVYERSGYYGNEKDMSKNYIIIGATYANFFTINW